MHIDEHGQGRTVVLLHGSPTSLEYLEPLIADLSRDHCVLVPEFPGYGRSPRLSSGWSIDDVLDALEADLLALDARDVSLVGFSGGAFRGLRFALRKRAVTVRNLVTLGGFAGLSPEHAAGLTALGARIRTMKDFRLETAFRRELAELFVAPTFARSRPEALPAVERWLDATTPEVLAEELEVAAREADLSPQLERLDIPITAIVGDEDVATPAVYSEALARKCPRGRLVRIPNAGHALFLEAPGPTLEAIREALSR